ncbi:MAG TPA: MaoC family dehydratase N-terminal domain-containing protein [Candidatus Dormibacteraeota bacterium]|nr:MaoC family dehydratase N-terminal domain-containing protein [Candidatus Dormibacteraeota bacterium]
MGREYPAVSFVIEADHVAAFARSIGASPEDGVPPTYAASYALFTTAPALFGDTEAGVDLGRLLHAEQEFEWQRHPEVGETVIAQGRVVSDEERRGMRFIRFETTCTVAGAPLCRSQALFIIRGKQ